MHNKNVRIQTSKNPELVKEKARKKLYYKGTGIKLASNVSPAICASMHILLNIEHPVIEHNEH